jgi:hypothetical protein
LRAHSSAADADHEYAAVPMPLFVIERIFPEGLDLTKEDVDRAVAINDETGVRWLFSFQSADGKRIYCLYEAEGEDSIREASKRNGIPADVITEVSELRPEQFV